MLRRLAVAVVLVLSGCGYRFAAGPATLPENIRVVNAPVFRNHTSEPGLQAVFTQALRSQLTRAGVSSSEHADAELSGEIISVWMAAPVLEQRPGMGSEPILASYRVAATARLNLNQGGKGLANVEVTGTEEFLPGADILQTEANRQAALRRLADRLMRDGFERLATSG